MTTTSSHFVVFRLGEQRYAVSLPAVNRVVFAVEVTFLPQAPAIIMGVINVAGAIVPVLNLRRRLGLAEHEVCPADQFLIIRTSQRTIALVIDEALGVIESRGDEIIATDPLVPNAGQVPGMIRLPDGLVLIHDLEKVLSLEESEGLAEALNQEVLHGS